MRRMEAAKVSVQLVQEWLMGKTVAFGKKQVGQLLELLSGYSSRE